MLESFRVRLAPRSAKRARRVAFAASAALSSLAPSARATTTLSVDVSTSLHPVTHAASGSLYGLTEKTPADLNALVAPLMPNVFNNPAADVQQPVGDAIVVAGRVAPLGARVSIRLADWFPNWPYRFTTMNDWFDKLGQTVSRKLAASVDNYYGYEIWNEPNGTWTSSMSFNDFWQQTYAKLRALDPGAKIIGPSISSYDASYLKNFLTYAKANDCVPDIMSWHELSGGNLTANFQSYRALEQSLGIGPLPISINEYSGKNDLNDEGMPAASAPMIAKFERFGIDSACISYWDVAHPGRLGSLLASDTSPNGGWWFYKWYGDMRGTMVATTPPTPNDAAALDGFANLDASTGKVSVLFAGVNDGSIALVVQGFAAAAPFFGSKIHAVVEHTPWVNRSTVVTTTDTVTSADLTVNDDRVSVSVPGTNGTDGYRLTLTAVAGGAGNTAGMGGASGGMSANGGAAGSRSATGGVSGGVSGAAGRGFAGGAAGVTSEGGRGGVGENAGAATAAGASSGVGGVLGSGTSGGGGTAVNAGGAATLGPAGMSGAGGVAELTAGSSSEQHPASAAKAGTPGCACSLERQSSAPAAAWYALFAAYALGWSRRRRLAR
jgi:hypothetical protein